MLRAIREHCEDAAAAILLKRVVPSLVMALSARLAADFHQQGRVYFHPKAVQAITALAVLGAHYCIYWWEILKQKAAEAKNKGGA